MWPAGRVLETHCLKGALVLKTQSVEIVEMSLCTFDYQQCFCGMCKVSKWLSIRYSVLFQVRTRCWQISLSPVST